MFIQSSTHRTIMKNHHRNGISQFKSRLLGIMLLAFASSATGSSENYSAGMSAASATVIQGSQQILKGAGQLIVVSAYSAGDSLIVVAKGVKDASEVTFKIASQAVAAASLTTGRAIELVTLSTGVLLVVSGKVLAMIPNAIGQSLLDRSEL